jgi:ppGpp synthetase/RelA/SpoT-type nucleotidyltranferase
MAGNIDQFLVDYAREYDFYQEAARLCSQQCEKLLDGSGIRAIVTFRAKRSDRLRAKLLKREKEQRAPYSSPEEMREDIVDLAGVRAALYFPKDRQVFDALVRDAFVLVAKKDFPLAGKPRPDRSRFSGYQATHYCVRLKEDDLPESQRRYTTAMIEIQVASVLMHAWAEVEHDLVYKPLTGDISEDELAILDELNGLVHAGEIALERLQRAVETRVARQGSTFSNHYELAAFLYEEEKKRRAGEL